jgi:dipeptidyl aminopeptidase/acylaminoacyl peptidase
MLPPGERPFPAAVIAQGSGGSDRSNQWSRDIAEELVRHGVAVLLTDKRGSGASDGDWRTASFADLAEDVVAGVAFLRRRSDVDSGRVGVVGLSQGGQVVPIAAASSDQIAFVINVSGKAVGFAEGSFLEMSNTARQAGLGVPDVQEVIRVNLAAVRYLTTGDWDQYAQARERALQTGAQRIAAGFPALASEPIWTFLRAVVTYDPLAYWVQVTQPVLVVYGEEDEDNNVPVRESVRRLEHVFRSANKTNHKILTVPGAGHGIRDAQTHRLAPRFRDTLGVWLEEFVKR